MVKKNFENPSQIYYFIVIHYFSTSYERSAPTKYRRRETKDTTTDESKFLNQLNTPLKLIVKYDKISSQKISFQLLIRNCYPDYRFSSTNDIVKIC